MPSTRTPNFSESLEARHSKRKFSCDEGKWCTCVCSSLSFSATRAWRWCPVSLCLDASCGREEDSNSTKAGRRTHGSGCGCRKGIIRRYSYNKHWRCRFGFGRRKSAAKTTNFGVVSTCGRTGRWEYPPERWDPEEEVHCPPVHIWQEH